MTETIDYSDLCWNYWATVLYIFGMFGYLITDTLSYLAVNVDDKLFAAVYTFLALIFVIDAILYNIDWYVYAIQQRDDTHPLPEHRIALLACVFHHIGSQCYLVGAMLMFNKLRWIREYLLVLFFGILALTLESTLTFAGWILSLKRQRSSNFQHICYGQSIYLWAHLLNIVGAIIYLCATSLAYRFYNDYAIIDSRSILILQMLGDIVYLFDAYLYYDCWKEDEKQYKQNNEREQLIELRLSRSLFSLDENESELKNNE